jgi:hypothetical protein
MMTDETIKIPKVKLFTEDVIVKITRIGAPDPRQRWRGIPWMLIYSQDQRVYMQTRMVPEHLKLFPNNEFRVFHRAIITYFSDGDTDVRITNERIAAQEW